MFSFYYTCTLGNLGFTCVFHIHNLLIWLLFATIFKIDLVQSISTRKLINININMKIKRKEKKTLWTSENILLMCSCFFCNLKRERASILAHFVCAMRCVCIYRVIIFLYFSKKNIADDKIIYLNLFVLLNFYSYLLILNTPLYSHFK